MNTTHFPLIHRGSVKNIHGNYTKSPLVFHFSNRYSVFDWGEMPDHIERKGEALAAFTAGMFTMISRPNVWKELLTGALPHLQRFERDVLEKFQARGMAHHYLGKFNLYGQKLGTHVSTDCIGVLPFQVLRPATDSGKYDYQLYQNRPERCLIPLEAIFRFSLPEGSSLLKRASDPNVLKDLELDHPPVPGEKFARPLIEFSTKLEPTDRMLSKQEAQEISGCTASEFQSLIAHISLLAHLMKEVFRQSGIELQDGKFEFGFGERPDGQQRELILLDAVGPDELRLESQGIQLSKEVIRRYYRKTMWFQNWEKYKNEQIQKNRTSGEDWKAQAREIVGMPPSLPNRFKTGLSFMYCALANVVADGAQINRPFPGMPPLAEIARTLKEFA